MRKGAKAAKWAARSERLSAALRENLKRRKAQGRCELYLIVALTASGPRAAG
jgi:hypothetical protein